MTADIAHVIAIGTNHLCATILATDTGAKATKSMTNGGSVCAMVIPFRATPNATLRAVKPHMTNAIAKTSLNLIGLFFVIVFISVSRLT
jgi:hypothetical protein